MPNPISEQEGHNYELGTAQCTICNQQDEAVFCELVCGHGKLNNSPFHFVCILEHILNSRANNAEPTCPQCNQAIEAVDQEQMIEEAVEAAAEPGMQRVEILIPQLEAEERQRQEAEERQRQEAEERQRQEEEERQRQEEKEHEHKHGM
jgi:hypothetical protein